ncbi:MAG: shikimate kinase [Deferribacteraceae bacterium]|jgi:shikimate kinase|nr:shikimate kinase [Deferribacteraceae bacterium]
MIFLTGFLCTGKSTVGKALAARRNLPFTDLDTEIERLADLPVAEIFQRYGSERFRKLESEALKTVQSGVVACGGGTITIRENLRWMRANGKILLLTATPTEIFKRLSSDYARPLMGSAPTEMMVKRLLFARACHYTQADLLIDTTNVNIDTILERIDEHYQ